MVKKIDKSCIQCTNKGTLAKKLGIFLCTQCRHLPKYTLISKTDSKCDYFLTDGDLLYLEAIEANSSYGPATYYRKEDLINKFCLKYKTDEENYPDVRMYLTQERWANIQEKKANREANLATKIQKRTASLTKALNKVGLILRADSQLCQKYINSTLKPMQTINEIVDRMCQMKYLYEYCHMEECKGIAYDEHAEEYASGYFPDCSVSDYAELIALKKYSNGSYPAKYPWLLE